MQVTLLQVIDNKAQKFIYLIYFKNLLLFFIECYRVNHYTSIKLFFIPIYLET